MLSGSSAGSLIHLAASCRLLVLAGILLEQLDGYAKDGVAGDAPELATGRVPDRLAPPRATTARASRAAMLHDLLVSLAERVEVHRQVAILGTKVWSIEVRGSHSGPPALWPRRRST